MEIKYIVCDGCGKKIEKVNPWYIEIYEHHSKDGKISVEGATKNIERFSKAITGRQSHYCLDCVHRIEYFIKSLKEDK